jgi:hypothetical protein
VEPVVGGDQAHFADRLDAMRLRWRDEVVEERVAAGEALDAEELLGV